MIKKVMRGTPPKQVWLYDIRIGGRRLREALPTKQEAEEAVAAIRTDARRLRFGFPADKSRISIKQVAEAWTAHQVKSQRSPKRIRHAERAFEHLAKVLPLASPVTKLTTDHLSQFCDIRLKAGSARATVWNDLSAIMAALHNGAKLREMAMARWDPPGRPELSRPKSGRSRVISQDEAARIIEALRGIDPAAAAVFQIGMGTAMRCGEILSLAWSDINWDRSTSYPFGWLTARATKTRDRSTDSTDDRIVPMNESVAGVLHCRKVPFEPAVFTDTNYAAVLKALKAACLSEGIPYGRKNPGGLVFHDCRHTAITRMLQAGADIKTVMDLAGHRRASTTMGYTHSSAESRFKAIAVLGK